MEDENREALPEDGQESQGNNENEAQQAEPGKGSGLDALPEEFSWVKKELKDVREEAARYRKQRGELQAKLENSKTQEEFEEVRKQFAAEQAQLEKELEARRLVSEKGLLAGDVDLLLKVDTDAMGELADSLAARTGVRREVPARELESPAGGSPVRTESGHDLWAAHSKRRPVSRPW